MENEVEECIFQPSTNKDRNSRIKEPAERMLINPDSYNNYVNRLKDYQKKKVLHVAESMNKPGSGKFFKSKSGANCLSEASKLYRPLTQGNIAKETSNNANRDLFKEESPQDCLYYIERTKIEGVNIPVSMNYDDAVKYLQNQLRQINL